MLSQTNRPIEDLIRRSCAAADPLQPHARQLEQVAAAAMAFGLRQPARPGQQAWPGLGVSQAVADFVVAGQLLDDLARRAGVPQQDILAGLLLKHCQADLAPLTAEEVARYALDFAMKLAASEPRLAARLRSAG